MGYTCAVENRIGELRQVFLVAEGWRSSRNGPHPALRPEHALDRVEVVMSLEDEFAIDISDDQAAELRTVGDVLACVSANVARMRPPAAPPAA